MSKKSLTFKCIVGGLLVVILALFAVIKLSSSSNLTEYFFIDKSYVSTSTDAQQQATADTNNSNLLNLDSKISPIDLENYEATFIRQAEVRDIILYNGREYALKINEQGAFGNNAIILNSDGELAVESHRNSYYVIAAGLLAPSETERSFLLDKGMRSMEWIFKHQLADGTFPRNTEKKDEEFFHPWSMFLQSASRNIILIRQDGTASQDILNRAEALVPKIELSVSWIANHPELEKYAEKNNLTNQLIAMSLAMHQTGVIANNQNLTYQAKALVQKSIARQLPDGTIPEKTIGTQFDSSYQSFSLEMLTRYATLTNDPKLNHELTISLDKGLEKLRSTILSNGRIDTKENTRTLACGPRVIGSGPKGKGIDIIPLRLYYYAYFSDRYSTYTSLAQNVMLYGQNYDHDDTCKNI